MKPLHESPNNQNPENWPLKKLLVEDGKSTNLLEQGGLRLSRQIKESESKRIEISFLTVVKNRCKSIERTIKSIIDQYHPLVEHIIIDGASTDGTTQVIRSYSDKIELYISQPDKNLYQAINYGIEYCRGNFICVINSDDWITKNSIKRVLSDIKRLKRCDTILSYGAWKIKTGTKPKLWQPREATIGDYFRCPDLCHNALFIPRKAYSIVGKYDETYSITADSKWILSAIDRGIKFTTNPYPTCFYSTDGVSSDGTRHWKECKRIIREKFSFLDEESAEKLLAKFYSYKNSIPQAHKIEISEQELRELITDQRIEVYLNDAIRSDAQSRKKQRLTRTKIKLLKIYWRAKHRQWL